MSFFYHHLGNPSYITVSDFFDQVLAMTPLPEEPYCLLNEAEFGNTHSVLRLTVVLSHSMGNRENCELFEVRFSDDLDITRNHNRFSFNAPLNDFVERYGKLTFVPQYEPEPWKDELWGRFVDIDERARWMMIAASKVFYTETYSSTSSMNAVVDDVLSVYAFIGVDKCFEIGLEGFLMLVRAASINSELVEMASMPTAWLQEGVGPFIDYKPKVKFISYPDEKVVLGGRLFFMRDEIGGSRISTYIMS